VFLLISLTSVWQTVTFLPQIMNDERLSLPLMDLFVCLTLLVDLAGLLFLRSSSFLTTGSWVYPIKRLKIYGVE